MRLQEVRLGCLPYLNVKPLVYKLEHGGLPAGWELMYAPPSELARMLSAGEIDAAPVSSFATFVNPSLQTCPGICIAAYGPVRSVLLLSKKPIEQIETIALDTSSLSGANMLKIILSESDGLNPSYVHRSPSPVSSMLDDADAAMVIGNPAMTCSKDGLHIMDLSDEWKKLTGLPAVFAVWAGTNMTPELVEILQEAKADGLTRISTIAAEESDLLQLPYDVCEDYLSNIMIYDLKEREAAGLAEFKRMSAAHNLLNRGASI